MTTFILGALVGGILAWVLTPKLHALWTKKKRKDKGEL